MGVLQWIIDLRDASRRNALIRARTRAKRKEIENGTYTDHSTFGDAQFADDYQLATSLMREVLNKNFPDTYHARTRLGFDPAVDYGAVRCEAIDASSAAIAASLRGGAGIIQAVKCGHRSIGF